MVIAAARAPLAANSLSLACPLLLLIVQSAVLVGAFGIFPVTPSFQGCASSSAAVAFMSSSPPSSSSASSDAASSRSEKKEALHERYHRQRKPAPGDVVTVDLVLTPEGDFVPEPLFDSTGRLTFVLGGGNYLPGLHELLESMVPGESITGTSVDAGWGSRNPDWVATVPKSAMVKDGGNGGGGETNVEVGMTLRLANGMTCVVTDVSEKEVTIDANPPLAGASYAADVTLVSVEDGPDRSGYKRAEEDEEGGGKTKSRYAAATFALGCFWGGELAYQRLPGVVGTKVGYTQGHKVDPTYQEVCAGTTGHAEAIQVTYDPSVVLYESLVALGMDRLGDDVFKLNQVGNDKGTQYRHGIYYHDDDQRDVAKSILDKYGDGCVTELEPAGIFYDAEEYHQQYLLKGGQSARKGADETIRCYG